MEAISKEVSSKIKENKYDEFTKGKINKIILKLAIPTIISLFVAELYNMVDTFFVGRDIGATAIGALSIAFPVQRLITAIGLLIAIGASTGLSRSLGKKDYDNVIKIISTALTMIIFIIGMVLLIAIFIDPILYKLGATQNIFPYAKKYVFIVIWGGIFQCVTFVIGYMMLSLGHPNVNLISTSIGAASNIILNIILVSEFGYGVKGSAIATVISQIIATIYSVNYFRRSLVQNKLKFSFKIYKNIAASIIAIGFSTFVVEISDAVVSFVLNNILCNYGDNAIVVVGVVSRISMFLYITMIGISVSIQPIVAFNYGAKNYERIKEVTQKAIKYVVITSTIIWAVMMIGARYIIGSFVIEQSVLEQSIKAFRIVISVFPAVGVYYVSIYFYQAMREAKLSLVLSVYRQILIFIPMIIILEKIFGLSGVLLAYPATDIISSLTGLYYMKKGINSMEDFQLEKKLKVESVMN